ncbi:hypothetical protein [Actinoplanes regularis]|uniref:hypothetical protein n=1 Tax=Actinoplanes regularis TaxID=52697 RepID=UPI001177FC51|nr:hypothetical protein [Actinoplanes regularis]
MALVTYKGDGYLISRKGTKWRGSRFGPVLADVPPVVVDPLSCGAAEGPNTLRQIRDQFAVVFPTAELKRIHEWI